jgi:hypothetical protein
MPSFPTSAFRQYFEELISHFCTKTGSPRPNLTPNYGFRNSAQINSAFSLNRAIVIKNSRTNPAGTPQLATYSVPVCRPFTDPTQTGTGTNN